MKGQGSEERGVQTFISVLNRRRNLAISLFLICCGTVAILTFQEKPLYYAQTVLLVENNRNLSLLNENVQFYPTRKPESNHLEMLKSITVAERVWSRLGEEVKVGLANPHPPKSSYEGAMKLLSAVNLKLPRETNLITLGIKARRPDLAVSLVNSYAATYQDYILEWQKADIREVRRFIETQLTDVEKRLKESEEKLKRYKEKNGLISLNSKEKILIDNGATIRALLEETRSEKKGVEEEMSHIQALIGDEGKGIGDRLGNISSPVIQSLKKTLEELELERVRLMMDGADAQNPKLVVLKKRVMEVKKALKEESEKSNTLEGIINPLSRLERLNNALLDLEIDYTRLAAREKILLQQLSSYEAEIQKLPAVEQDLAELTREVEAQRKIYTLLQEKYEEAKIEEAGRIPEVRIVDPAWEAKKIKPDLFLNIIAGLIFGLVFALSSVWMVEYLDTTIKTREDLSALSLSVYSQIPDLTRYLVAKDTKERFFLVSNPDSSTAEAFRILRTALAFAAPSSKPKTLLITSAQASEGKSTIALNLAYVLAKSGKKTLLMDCDLRRPVLHTIFETKRKPGLTDLIIDKVAIESVIIPTPVENLYFLPAGTTPPSPADLLNSNLTEELLSSLKQDFEYIIIDTPPVLIAADTLILASKVDGVLLVVYAERTKRETVKDAMEVLQNTPGKLLGCVLNGVKPSRRHGYYYYHHYYYQSDHQPKAQRGNSKL